MIDPESLLHGVIDDARIIYDAHREGVALSRPHEFPLNNIEQLLMLARGLNLEQLFIVRDSKIWKRARRFNRKFIEECGEWTVRPTRLNNVMTAWKNDARVQIIFCGINKRLWPLEDITDAGQLFETVATLQKVLGVRITAPVHTGKQLALAGMRQKYFDGCIKSLEPFRENKQHGILYRRDLTNDEKKRTYLHVYDKNKMFLSACGIVLGNGAYTHYQSNKFDRKLPGIWRVKMQAGAGVPEYVATMLGGQKVKGWFYTPQLIIFERAGYSMHVEEAEVWRDTFRPLEGFYRTLRHAFEHFTKGSIYEKCCKAIFTQFVGWLSPANPDLRAGDDFARPDWKHSIIAEANARLLANIFKLYQNTGLSPAGIYVDELYYFSDEPDAQKALPYPFTGAEAQYKARTFEAARAVELWERFDTIKKIKRELEK